MTLPNRDDAMKKVHERLAQRFERQKEEKVTQHLNTLSSVAEKIKRVKQDRDTVFDGDTSEILAGPLPVLLNALANHAPSDKAYVDIFLATHTSLLPSTELLKFLTDQFKNPQPPENVTMNDDELRHFVSMVRMRLLNVIKKWVVNQRKDFEDPRMKSQFDQFLGGLLDDFELHSLGKFLQESWKGLTKFDLDIKQPSRMTSAALKKVEATSTKKISFLQFDIIEFGRQLVLKRQTLSTVVRPVHFLDWAKGKESESNPIHALNSFSSRLQDWAITQICTQNEIKNRIRLFRNFVKLVFELLELNDFCGAVDIYCALNGYLVSRLKKTRRGLDTKTEEKFKSLEALMSPAGSWRALRVRMTSAPAPYTIPPAIFIRDLVTIHENDDMWDKSKDMINFHKRRLIALVIFQFQESTREAYPFVDIPFIQKYMDALPILPTEELEEITSVLEPKEEKKTGKK